MTGESRRFHVDHPRDIHPYVGLQGPRRVQSRDLETGACFGEIMGVGCRRGDGVEHGPADDAVVPVIDVARAKKHRCRVRGDDNLRLHLPHERHKTASQLQPCPRFRRRGNPTSGVLPPRARGPLRRPPCAAAPRAVPDPRAGPGNLCRRRNRYRREPHYRQRPKWRASLRRTRQGRRGAHRSPAHVVAGRLLRPNMTAGPGRRQEGCPQPNVTQVVPEAGLCIVPYARS